MSSPQPQVVLTPLQQLLLQQMGLPPTPQNVAIAQLTDNFAKLASALQSISDRLGAIQAQLAAPLYVKEQYNFNERKLVTLPFSATGNPYYEFKLQDAKILVIITDSIIQFDLNQGLTTDSPQLSGNAATYATLAIGVDRMAGTKRFYAKLASGSTGNVWLMIGN